MGKSKVMIVGSINQDIIFSNPIKSTEVGMMFADYTLANGGKGANQASTASKLGAESAIVGRVGNDLYGNSQLNGLKALGVNTDYVVVDENNKTGAGDTFTAALGIALCEGKEITEAIRFANAAGAICVSRRGGQPSVPTKDEVLQFFAKNR